MIKIEYDASGKVVGFTHTTGKDVPKEESPTKVGGSKVQMQYDAEGRITGFTRGSGVPLNLTNEPEPEPEPKPTQQKPSFFQRLMESSAGQEVAIASGLLDMKQKVDTLTNAVRMDTPTERYQILSNERFLTRGPAATEADAGPRKPEPTDVIQESILLAKKSSGQVLKAFGIAAEKQIGPMLAQRGGVDVNAVNAPPFSALVSGPWDLRKTGEWLESDVGKALKAKGQELINNSGPDLEPIIGPDGLDKSKLINPLYWTKVFATSFPYMLAMAAGTAVTANPLGGFITAQSIYGGQAIDEYESKCLENGWEIDPQIASKLYTYSGGIQAILDYAGMAPIIHHIPIFKTFLGKALGHALIEGTTELGQEAVDEIAAYVGYDDAIDLVAILNAGLMGLGMGGMMSPLAPYAVGKEEGKLTPELYQEPADKAQMLKTILDVANDTERVVDAVNETRAAEKKVNEAYREKITVDEEPIVNEIMQLAGVIEGKEEAVIQEEPEVKRSVFRRSRQDTEANLKRYEENPASYKTNVESYVEYLITQANADLDAGKPIDQTVRDRLFDLANKADTREVAAAFCGNRERQMEFKQFAEETSAWAEQATVENEPVYDRPDVEIAVDMLEADENKEWRVKPLMKKEARDLIKKYRKHLLDAGMEKKAANKKAVELAYDEKPSLYLSSLGNFQPLYDAFEKQWTAFKTAKAENEALSRQLTEAGFKRSYIDSFANARKYLEAQGLEGQRVIEHFITAFGASARADQVVKKVKKTVYKKLNKSETDTLNSMIFAKRVIQLNKDHPKMKFYIQDGVHVNGPVCDVYLKGLKEKLGEEQYAKLDQRSRLYFMYGRKMLRMLHQNGLISDKTYENLKDKDYQERTSVEAIDPDLMWESLNPLAAKETGVTAIRKDSEGSLLETDGLLLLEKLIINTHKRIMQNEAASSLALLADKHPDNEFVRKLHKKKGKWDIPGGFTKFSIWRDGKKQNYAMANFFAREWQASTAGSLMSYDFARFVRTLSGSNILKPMATGLNYKFAIKQLPMDLLHIWFTSQVPTGEITLPDGSKKIQWKSTFNPIGAPFQMTQYLPGAFIDSLYRRGDWKRAIDSGLGMYMLASPQTLMDARLGKNSKMKDMVAALGHLAETMEYTSRITLFKQLEKQHRKIAEKNGEVVTDEEISRRAAAGARDYLDYHQGGSITKAFDTGIPYLNASTQVARGTVRSFKRNPAEQIAKVGLLLVPELLAYAAMRQFAPEAQKDIPEKTKDLYYTFPIPGCGYTDVNGEYRYIYAKVPKDKSLAPFGTMWRAMIMKMYGDEVDGEVLSTMVKNAASNLSPVDIASLPPVLNATFAWLGNYDTWDRDLVYSGPNVSEVNKRLGHDTSTFAKDLGDLVRLSPDKIQAAMDKIFTDGNELTMMFGWMYDFMRQVPASQREEYSIDLLHRFPFLGVSIPGERYRKDAEVTLIKANDALIVSNMKIRDAVRDYMHPEGNTTEFDLRQLAYDAPSTFERKRRLDYIEMLKSAYEIEEGRSFWLSKVLIQPTPEARAEMVYKRLMEAPEEKAMLMRQAKKIKGLYSDRFRQALDRYTILGLPEE